MPPVTPSRSPALPAAVSGGLHTTRRMRHLYVADALAYREPLRISKAAFNIDAIVQTKALSVQTPTRPHRTIRTAANYRRAQP